MENGNMTRTAERLTFEGNFCEIANCKETRRGKYCPDGACSQRKVWERLKQFEDSDAVPVVRCKDCRHISVERGLCFCNVWEKFNGMGYDGFCNYGETEK